MHLRYLQRLGTQVTRTRFQLLWPLKMDRNSLDQATIKRIVSKLASVTQIKDVKNAGLSSDGQADELIALAKGSSSIYPSSTIDNMQIAIKGVELPTSLQAHLAGD